MPQIFKIGSYWVYFWTNENEPLEPVHIHIAEGKPSLMQQKCGLQRTENVRLQITIPAVILNKIIRVIEIRSFEIISKWKETFGEISFYC